MAFFPSSDISLSKGRKEIKVNVIEKDLYSLNVVDFENHVLNKINFETPAAISRVPMSCTPAPIQNQSNLAYTLKKSYWGKKKLIKQFKYQNNEKFNINYNRL